MSFIGNKLVDKFKLIQMGIVFTLIFYYVYKPLKERTRSNKHNHRCFNSSIEVVPTF